MSKNIEQLTVNTIRALSVDQVQAANSGHPGITLGAAPITYTLWSKFMNYNVDNPEWINRDRFVLSAGHGSALLYSMLHLFGYGLTIEDLKGFRQLGSLTPGHPELGHTKGVDITTGPLGAGLASAVGMAMGQAHMAATYNKDNYEVFDNFTYVLCGDGCLSEGISSEASSLAGTLKLGRLIVIYDSNNITIEGSTDLSLTENVRKRYEAYGFDTFFVEDGNDLEAIEEAIKQAKSNLDKPSFIEVKTKIGYGSVKEGTSEVHGSPLGAENVVKLKEFLEYPSTEPFYVAEEVYKYTKEITDEAKSRFNKWDEMFKDYKQAYPELAKQLEDAYKPLDINELLKEKSLLEFDKDSIATRSASGVVLNKLNNLIPNMFGGSADLAPSNMTHMKDAGSFSSETYCGKNIHFGIRENAMAAMGNGLAAYGGMHNFVATFFVFADYLKPMARLSSIMNLPLTYVLTHDSIGVGEDGQTHEPIEQLTMLRAQPNFYTFRPADAKETAYGWMLALSSKKTPVGLILSRQNLPVLSESNEDCLRGGYVVKDSKSPEVILMASGSEVSLALDSAKELEAQNVSVRVVSMPCMELFEEQSKEYKESVLPSNITKRIALEAGSSVSWGKYVGLDGEYVTLDTFGASGPGPLLFKEFGFTVENVVNKVKEIM